MLNGSLPPKLEEIINRAGGLRTALTPMRCFSVCPSRHCAAMKGWQ